MSFKVPEAVQQVIDTILGENAALEAFRQQTGLICSIIFLPFGTGVVCVYRKSRLSWRLYMRESVIERKLLQAVRQSGGLALKLISPGFNGVPDRLLLFMGGKAAFCEVKAPGQKPRPLQVHRMEQLRKMGFKVFVVDDVNQIGGIIDEICSA